MKKFEAKVKSASKPKGRQCPKIKTSSISYFSSINQFKDDPYPHVNIKPTQGSFINNSLFGSLLLQAPIINHGLNIYYKLISKLFKFLKQKLTPDIYTETKTFFREELNKTQMNGMNHNESLSSVFEMNTTSDGYDNKNDRKLKLSYDFNNQKVKSMRNKNISHSKNTGKELHSLYSIIKGNHKMISHHFNPSNTQSNSKSRSKSTSREFSSNQTNHQVLSSQKHKKKIMKVNASLINQSQPLLNGKLFSKLNIRLASKNKYPFPKKTLSKATLNNNAPLFSTSTFNGNAQSMPLHKLSSTNNNNTHSKSMTPCHHNTQCQKIKNTQSLLFHNKPSTTPQTATTVQTQINQNKTLNLDNRKTSNLTDYDNLTSTYSNRNPIINPGLDIEYIDSQSNEYSITKRNFTESNQGLHSNSQNGKEKTEDMMKAIKSTLDDNLKIMFNFSYENFLSKESASESKNNSFQEINSNDYSDHHCHTTTNRKR